MPEPHIIDAEYEVVRRRGFRLIWADRVGLIILLLVAALLAFRAAEGSLLEMTSVDVDGTLFWALGPWLAMRGLDFIFTGRIRYWT